MLPLASDSWIELLVIAGLTEITARTFTINLKDESRGILQRYGFGGMLSVLARTLRLYASSPAYREFVKSVRQGGIVPPNLKEYFGYGLFVGRKCER